MTCEMIDQTIRERDIEYVELWQIVPRFFALGTMHGGRAYHDSPGAWPPGRAFGDGNGSVTKFEDGTCVFGRELCLYKALDDYLAERCRIPLMDLLYRWM